MTTARINMTLNEYQYEANRTAAGRESYRAPELAVLALGLTGEAGEFADAIKKHLGHGHTLDTPKLVKELGDVLWYVAAAASALGYGLAEVAQMNVDKLRARYPEGFSTAASVARVDTRPLLDQTTQPAHTGGGPQPILAKCPRCGELLTLDRKPGSPCFECEAKTAPRKLPPLCDRPVFHPGNVPGLCGKVAVMGGYCDEHAIGTGG